MVTPLAMVAGLSAVPSTMPGLVLVLNVLPLDTPRPRDGRAPSGGVTVNPGCTSPLPHQLRAALPRPGADASPASSARAATTASPVITSGAHPRVSQVRYEASENSGC